MSDNRLLVPLVVLLVGGGAAVYGLRSLMQHLVDAPATAEAPPVVADPAKDTPKRKTSWITDWWYDDAGRPRARKAHPQGPLAQQRPAAAEEEPEVEEEEKEVNVYAQCEALEDSDAEFACQESIDDRIDALRDQCDAYDDVEQWADCLEAADRLQPYSG